MLYFMLMAGGRGSRMNSPELPKQFLKLRDEPIIIRTLRNFTEFGTFRAGVICCPLDWIEYAKALLYEYGLASENIFVVPGGGNRNASVLKGCRFIIDNFDVEDDDIVLTHDAVRPFISPRIIRDNIAAAIEFGAANTVQPVYDSVIRSLSGDYITDNLNRSELYRVQTPQTFHLNQLNLVLSSLSAAEGDKYTDVASVFNDRGFRVRLVPGEDTNIKITTPFDMAVANTVIDNLP